jgi:hypothetical protein
MKFLPPAITRRAYRRLCHGGIQLARKLSLPYRDTSRQRLVAMRLVEETEAHVVVGLLLLC